MYYAVIDTNVLVSALIAPDRTGSAPVKIVEFLYQGRLVPIYNEEILAEYEEVLSRDKFNFDPLNVKTLLEQIKEVGIHEQRLSSDEIFPDLDDAVFFEVTLAHRMKDEDTYLVTGNIKHFPAKSFVVSPREMVDIMEFVG